MYAAGTPILASLFSVFFVGDSLGWWGWTGGVIIILSVMSSGFFVSPHKKNLYYNN